MSKNRWSLTNPPGLGYRELFIHLNQFKYLRDYLKARKAQLKKLNMKVAYQRPCTSRYSGGKDYLLDEIFDLIGVQRVKRNYDGIDALCCGVEMAGPNLKLFPRGKNFEPFRQKNVKDAKDHGAEAIVYLCAMCFATLNKKAREIGMGELYGQ